MTNLYARYEHFEIECHGTTLTVWYDPSRDGPDVLSFVGSGKDAIERADSCIYDVLAKDVQSAIWDKIWYELADVNAQDCDSRCDREGCKC